MVHWGWLVAALAIGGFIGFMTFAIFSVGKGEDAYYDRIWKDE